MEMVKILYKTIDVTFSNIEESPAFSEIKEATDHNSLLYIISAPTKNQEPYNQLIVKPLTIRNLVNKIKFGAILVYNKKKNIRHLK